jgi:hypothetical protein
VKEREQAQQQHVQRADDLHDGHEVLPELRSGILQHLDAVIVAKAFHAKLSRARHLKFRCTGYRPGWRGLESIKVAVDPGPTSWPRLYAANRTAAGYCKVR